MSSPGWGAVFGKIFNWLPKKEEYYRNEITKTKKAMDKLLDKPNMPADDRAKYRKLADKLQALETKLANGA